MRIAAKYSHMNGEEYLIVHQPELWQEVRDVVASVDAEACRTKLSGERGRRGGQMLYSPIEMNKAFEDGFGQRGWHEESRTFWVTSDERVLRGITGESPERQKAAIEEAGHTPIRTYNQTDFVKDRVAVEVQFGKYAFVAHDLFVKHLSFFVSDVIDVGIEILPVKELEASMSSGVPYYERDLLNVLRQDAREASSRGRCRRSCRACLRPPLQPCGFSTLWSSAPGPREQPRCDGRRVATRNSAPD